jgi:hypothetical protein
MAQEFTGSNRYGDERNITDMLEREKRNREKSWKKIWTNEPAVVYDYDIEAQRVDLVLRRRDEMMFMPDVPIITTGGDLTHVPNFNTYQDWLEAIANGTATEAEFPCIGTLLFPRTESIGAYSITLPEDSPNIEDVAEIPVTENPKLTSKHKGQGPVFLPPVQVHNKPNAGDGKAYDGEDIIDADATGDINKISEEDAGLIHRPTGSHIIFNDSGKTVIKGDELFIGKLGSDANNYNSAAREGDNVSGSGAGSISGGSQNVNIGD